MATILCNCVTSIATSHNSHVNHEKNSIPGSPLLYCNRYAALSQWLFGLEELRFKLLQCMTIFKLGTCTSISLALIGGICLKCIVTIDYCN